MLRCCEFWLQNECFPRLLDRTLEVASQVENPGHLHADHYRERIQLPRAPDLSQRFVKAFRHCQKSGIRLAATGIAWIALQGSETLRFGARPIAIEQLLYAGERDPRLRQCIADPESSRGQLHGPAMRLTGRHRTQKGSESVCIREPRVSQRKSRILGNRRFEIGDALMEIVLAQLAREIFPFEVILLSFEIASLGRRRL